MIDLFDIKGNVTVITGGTGVLGRTIAKYLALHGAEVIILGRKEDVGKAIIVDIYEALEKQTRMAPTGKTVGGSVEFMKTDVMNQQMVEECFVWWNCSTRHVTTSSIEQGIYFSIFLYDSVACILNRSLVEHVGLDELATATCLDDVVNDSLSNFLLAT